MRVYHETIGIELKAVYKGQEYTAQVDDAGMIHIDQKVYNSPSLAATHITHRPMNGWTFWRYQNQRGSG